jgi:hypothetical protein
LRLEPRREVQLERRNDAAAADLETVRRPAA